MNRSLTDFNPYVVQVQWCKDFGHLLRLFEFLIDIQADQRLALLCVGVDTNVIHAL